MPRQRPPAAPRPTRGAELARRGLQVRLAIGAGLVGLGLVAAFGTLLLRDRSSPPPPAAPSSGAAQSGAPASPPVSQASVPAPDITGSPARPPAAPTAPAATPPAAEPPAPLPPQPVPPPVPFTTTPPARPYAVVQEVYAFAAAHPEVLEYVPCFCGCEANGHRSNLDCFVAARDAAGRVTRWNAHGLG